MLWAELESLAHAPLEDAGAAAVLRWHALSGYSLALAQYTGGRVTLVDGTGALLQAIAGAAPFATPPRHPGRRGAPAAGGVEVDDARGRDARARAPRSWRSRSTRSGRIEFDPPLSEGKRAAIELGQASRGIKLFIHARGEPTWQNAIRPRHPFGYLDTELVLADATQVMIGFGPDAAACDAGDLAAVQRQLDEILPGYEVARGDRPRLARRRVLARHLGDPPPRLVPPPPRRDAAPRGPRATGRLGPRERLGGLHRRRDRDRASPPPRASSGCSPEAGAPARVRTRASTDDHAAGAGDHGVALDQVEVGLEQRAPDASASGGERGDVDAGAGRAPPRSSGAPRSRRERALDPFGRARQRHDRDVVEQLGPDAAEPDHERRHDRVAARGDDQLDSGAAIRSSSSAASVARRERREPTVGGTHGRRRCAGRARPRRARSCAGSRRRSA